LPRTASRSVPIALGDEWFSPQGVPAIAIPFYLAHSRLKSLELRQMMEVEGGTPEWCMMLLRHECGHAIDHAYQFSRRKEWRLVFGSPDAEYNPETYTPRLGRLDCRNAPDQAGPTVCKQTDRYPSHVELIPGEHGHAGKHPGSQ
jgi:hypothetical protein